MEWVYEAPYPIPELGVEKGDAIVVAPAATVPLRIMRTFDRNRLPAILEHLDRLTPLPSSGTLSCEPIHEHLRRAVGSDLQDQPAPLRLIP